MSGNVSKPTSTWPFMAALESATERGTVNVDNPARCVGCGCTDRQACREGCSWLGVDRRDGTGVCSNCPNHLGAWKAGRP